jgi:hypothetical protein
MPLPNARLRTRIVWLVLLGLLPAYIWCVARLGVKICVALLTGSAASGHKLKGRAKFFRNCRLIVGVEPFGVRAAQ